MESKLLDWRGAEIHPGDTIVYANYGSSSLFLVEATVLSIRHYDGEPKGREWKVIARTIRSNSWIEQKIGHTPRQVTLIAMDKITVVPAVKEQPDVL